MTKKRKPADYTQKWTNAFKGKKASREYRSWRSMINRCTSGEPHMRKYYGHVSICDRWLNSFEDFLTDMGPRPEGMSLDRWPDAHGNYEPDNCRWATKKAQHNNMRNNVVADIGMFTGTIAEWCDALKMDRNASTAVYRRLSVGWTPYEALFTPRSSSNTRGRRAVMP